MTFEYYLQQFMLYLRAGEKTENTVSAYTRDLLGFNKWFQESNGEEAIPTNITPIDLREFKTYLLTIANQKPATINRKLASLSAFCDWSIREGIIETNPAERISPVAKANFGIKWLTKKEQYALLRAVHKAGNQRDIAIITILLHTGLRVTELSSLRLTDTEVSERKGLLTVRQGKGGKYRQIPLNNEVRKAMEVLLQHRPHLYHDYLLWGKKGEQLKPWGMQHILRKYAYLAQIDSVTPHTLRHTFGKNLVDAGVPIEQVATLMGHSSIETTRHYVAPGASDLEAAVSRLEVK